jgi:hypothetical protein
VSNAISMSPGASMCAPTSFLPSQMFYDDRQVSDMLVEQVMIKTNPNCNPMSFPPCTDLMDCCNVKHNSFYWWKCIREFCPMLTLGAIF